MSDIFRFKQFAIKQGRCAMKVNTDGILLGAWTNLSDKNTALDIGTGTGIIAMMMAQRNTQMIIHALEIDADAFLQASENMVNSPYSEKLLCIHQPVQEYAKMADIKYDLIVSNPPFFSGGTFSLNENKASVRHTIKLSHFDLLSSVKLLLKDDGHFDVVLPYIEGLRFVEMAAQYDFGAVSITEVRPKKEKNIERLLIRLAPKHNGKCVTNELIVQETDEANEYTEDMKALTKDFYLFMD
ncbi:MAG: methyltransferase [Saprospiraceae bacterium]|nr:methyltransferase [Saprospiraceae bacterium]